MFREVDDDPRSEAPRMETAARRGPRLRGPRGLASGYDEELADRIRELLSDLRVRVCVDRRCSADSRSSSAATWPSPQVAGGVLVSVDRSDTETLLQKPHTRPMVMCGREMSGWLRVDPDGLRTKRQFAPWVKRGVDDSRSLPPKSR